MNRSMLFVAAALQQLVLAQQQPYGDPTPGAGGFAPRLAAPGAWIGNTGFGFDVRCGVGGAPMLLVLGAARTSVPVFGFDLLVDPTAIAGSIFGLLSPGGAGQGAAFLPLPLSIAPTPALIGAAFYAQAIVGDAAAPGGFAASNGSRFELGLAPLVFVACSIANGDPFQLVDPAAGVIVDSGAPAQVDNTSGAVFARGGRRLFVASSIRSTIGMADVSTLPATWSTIYTGTGSCYGLAFDAQRRWLWTLTDPGSSVRELTAIDADEAHATFGQILFATTGVASGIYERWSLSPSGRRAALLTLLPNTLTIVDTDATSPTFLQNLATMVPVPTDQPSPISLATQVLVTPDDTQALVLIQLAGATPAEIARFDLATGTWIDHNPALPGSQNLSPSSQPPVVFGGAPNGFSLSATGRFAVVAGFNSCGWAGRLDLDPKNPLAFAWTQWAPGVSLQNAWTAGLSNDETEVAIATWPSSGCPAMASPTLLRLDAATGALLGSVAIPANSNGSTLQNLYTVVWR